MRPAVQRLFKCVFENDVSGIESVVAEDRESVHAIFFLRINDDNGYKFWMRSFIHAIMSPVGLAIDGTMTVLLKKDVFSKELMLEGIKKCIQSRIRSHYAEEDDLDGSKASWLNSLRYSPLHFAAINDSIDAAICLIHAGADINVCCARGGTFLQYGSDEFRARCEEVIRVRTQVGLSR